jgi:hypothetical protein
MSVELTIAPTTIRSSESILTPEQIALRATEKGILLDGYRNDLNKIFGMGPIADQLVLKDETFVGGGVGMSFFSKLRDPLSGREIHVHVKFLEDNDEESFLRIWDEAIAGKECYKGMHAPQARPTYSFGESHSPYYIPRLISLEKIGSEGIAPFEKQTKGKIMIVTERIEGSDLGPRDSEGNADFFDRRLEEFLDNPSIRNMNEIKKWTLFKKTKTQNFSIDTARLNSGRYLYLTKDPNHILEFEEALEIIDLFKKDCVIAASKVGIQLTDALQEVHNTGKVHQDIKPENVVLNTRGGLKLIDFGFIKDIKGQTEKPKTRVGTPLYWSLNYLISGKNTIQSEMWPVACIIIELISGKKFLEIVEEMQRERGILDEEDTVGSPRGLAKILSNFDFDKDLEDILGKIPDELSEILKVALHESESRRFVNMSEFGLRLKEFLVSFDPHHGQIALDSMRWVK